MKIIRYRVLILAAALPVLIISLGFGIYTALHPVAIEAAWFDDNWAYRTGYVISNTGGAVPNQWVTVNIDTRSGSGQTLENKIQSDCDDSRFTDSNGNSLKYYLSSGCNTATTVYHVLIPTISAGSNLIYHYYGNASATAGTEAADFTQSEFSPASTSTNNEEKGTYPVLYWGFNDSAKNQVRDSSPNDFLGIRTGMSWKPESFCVIGACQYIDGTDDNISLADNDKLDFVAADKFTITIWAKHNGPISTNPDYLITKAQTGYTGYKVYMDSDGDFCFDVSDGTNTDTACTTNANFDDDKWHHIAAVKDGIGSLKLYIDAQERASDKSIAATGPLGNTGKLYVGVDLDGTSNEWLGFVDEVKIYRDQTTPTPAQISSYYNSRSNESSNSGIGIKEQKYLTDGLVGYWDLNETSTGIGAVSRLDSSGNVTTLTDNGTTASNTGKFDKGADFELDNSEYLSAADNAVLSITGSLTLVAWIKPEVVTAGTYNIIAKWDGSNESYRLYQSADELVLEIETSNTVTTQAANLAAATWYHVVGVYDATAQTAKIYLNGIEQLTTTAGTIPSSITDDGGVFHIGAEDSTGGATGFYDGIIDEPRVYNRAFSSAEVFKLYDFAPGPVGYWKMDEGSWTNVCSGDDDVGDSSTNGNHGIACPASTGPKGGSLGKINKGGSFDGSNDRIEINDSASLDVTGGATFSAWVYWNSKSTEQSILGKWDAADVSYNLGSGASSTEFSLLVDGDGAVGSGCVRASSGAGLTTNTWYYLTATFDAGTIRLYKNGVYLNTGSACAFSSIYAGTSKLVLAALNDDPSQPFNGRLDDVKIYNYPRTQKQIIEDMNVGHPAPGSPFGSPVGQWKFDEGSTNTCSGGSNDACNSGSDGSTLDGAFGTLTAAPSITNTGKFGRALNFDGSDDTLTITNATAIDQDLGLNSGFTVSAWINADDAGDTNGDGQIFIKNTNTFLKVQNLQGNNLDISASVDLSTDATVTISAPITTGTWNHIVMSWADDDDDEVDVYVNGVLKGTSSNGVGPNSSDAANLSIGGTGTSTFDGTIDDFKIFGSPLTADQIKQEYNKGSSIVLGALSDSTSGNQIQSAAAQYCVPGDSTSCAGPAAEWKLDENTGTGATAVKDTSSNGNTSSTFSTPEWRPGKFGSGLYFDGSNDVVRFTEATSTDLGATTDSYILEAWINTATNFSANATILAKDDGSGAYPFSLYLDSSEQACFQISDGTNSPSVCGSTALNDGKWHYIVGKRDVSADTIYIYVDGIQINSATDSTTATAANDDDLSLGNSGTSYTANDFTGIIDHVTLFSYSRSNAQIAWDYNKGQPIGHWKMDECQGITINDSTGNGNTGTWSGSGGTNTSEGDCTTVNTATAWYNGRSGKLNYSLDFDNGDDVVNAGTATMLDDLAANAGFTVSAWINPASDGSGTAGRIADKTTGLGPVAGWIFYIGTSNRLGFGVDYSGVTNTNLTRLTANNTVTLNQWQHAVVTWTGSSTSTTIKFYINGREADYTSTGSNGDQTRVSDTAANLRIGNDSTGARPFDGQLDDARIYNYVLTPQQIKILYTGGAVRFGPATGPP